MRSPDRAALDREGAGDGFDSHTSHRSAFDALNRVSFDQTGGFRHRGWRQQVEVPRRGDKGAPTSRAPFEMTVAIGAPLMSTTAVIRSLSRSVDRRSKSAAGLRKSTSLVGSGHLLATRSRRLSATPRSRARSRLCRWRRKGRCEAERDDDQEDREDSGGDAHAQDR